MTSEIDNVPFDGNQRVAPKRVRYQNVFINGKPVLVKRCDHPVTGAPLRLGNVDDGSTMSF